MKRKQLLTMAVAAAISLSALSVSAMASQEADPLSFEDAVETELKITLDGKETTVTKYEDCYVANPTNVSYSPNEDGIDQKLSIYVPEGADENSPIIFYVNNAGWFSDAYSERRQVEDGAEYTSSSDTDEIGKGLASGYVIVSYGCRGRNDSFDEDGKMVSHSPATMIDTKAVIRYLRHNQDILPA